MNERDPEFDALWRSHSTETPPRALDDAIRAAAHRAVHAKPSTATIAPRARAPWPAWATFAAAASIGAIAIGVWQLQPREADETRVVTSDVPMHAAAPKASVPGDSEPSAATSHAQPLVDAKAGAPVNSPSSARAKNRDASTQATNALADTRSRNNEASTREMNAATPNPHAVAREERAAPTRNVAPAPAMAPKGSGSLSDKVEAASEPTQLAATQSSPFPAVDERASQRMAAQPSASMAMKNSADAAQPQSAGITQSVRRESARSVADYVDAIHRALAEHRDADAATTLAAMRAQYAGADTLLPADLREWAARVPRVSR